MNVYHPHLISLTESAEKLGISRRTAHRMIKRGDLPEYTRVGGPRSEMVTRRHWFNRAFRNIMGNLILPNGDNVEDVFGRC